MSTDKALVCRDCGTTFIFTTGEQEFYAQRGFTNEPSRCPSCRALRKANRDAGVSSYSSRGSSQLRTMHPIVCSQCGKEAEVPFVPSNDKPVYCSDCYEARRGDGRGDRTERRRW